MGFFNLSSTLLNILAQIAAIVLFALILKTFLHFNITYDVFECPLKNPKGNEKYYLHTLLKFLTAKLLLAFKFILLWYLYNI